MRIAAFAANGNLYIQLWRVNGHKVICSIIYMQSQSLQMDLRMSASLMITSFAVYFQLK